MWTLARRVYYDNTDAAGVVYHSEYLKWMEQARTEALFALDFDLVAMAEAGTQFVVHRLEVCYHGAARLGQMVDVDSRIIEVRGARIIWQQVVGSGDQRLVEATLTIACVDQSWRARRLPEALGEALRSVV